MTNPSKDKGSRWERDACNLLNQRFPGTWKRIAMSGAIGTQLNIPILRPDAVGEYSHYPQKFVAEAKVGYGGKEMKVHKDWFDHIQEVAEENYAIPLVFLKFEKSNTGARHIICMTFEVWDKLMSEIKTMSEELNRLHESSGRTLNEDFE
jgi:hypothetical protein